MKKKLLIIAASALCCACLAVGLTACDDDLKYHAAIEPTCTTRGNAEYWTDNDGGIYSDAEGKNVLDAIPEIEMLGHDWKEEITKSPSCTETGTLTIACQREGCGQKQEQQLEALGHDYEITVKREASCTVNGEAVRTCSRGDTADETITLKAGHNWDVDNTCKDCSDGVIVPTNGLNYVSILDEEGETIGYRATLRDETLSEIVVPYGRNGLPVLAVNFANATSLTHVTLPSSLESITATVFTGCENLKSIVVDGRNSDYFSEDGVLYHTGEEATTLVYAPPALEGTVAIASGVTAIPSEAFRFRTALEGVIIPASVKTFELNAFYGCELDTVTIASLEDWCSKSFANIWANPLSVSEELWTNEKISDLLRIPDGVTEIPDFAFYGFNVGSVVIPASVTKIGGYAFYGNTDLSVLGYTGTIAQWKKIIKGDKWNHGTPETYTLTCLYGGDELNYDKAGNPID